MLTAPNETEGSSPMPVTWGDPQRADYHAHSKKLYDLLNEVNGKFSDGAACVRWPHDLHPHWHVDEQGYVTGVDLQAYLYASLPIWDYYPSASEAAKAAWDSCYQALTEHELGHCLIAYNAIQTLESELVNRPKAEAEQRLRELIGELDAAQKQYDDETDHGVKTGVNLDYTSDDDDFPAHAG
jgi:predicted secreted Zn-dependent protease